MKHFPTLLQYYYNFISKISSHCFSKKNSGDFARVLCWLENETSDDALCLWLIITCAKELEKLANSLPFIFI